MVCTAVCMWDSLGTLVHVVRLLAVWWRLCWEAMVIVALSRRHLVETQKHSANQELSTAPLCAGCASIDARDQAVWLLLVRQGLHLFLCFSCVEDVVFPSLSLEVWVKFIGLVADGVAEWLEVRRAGSCGRTSLG